MNITTEELIKAGCKEITIDEPSMSCYAYKENPIKFVDIFNKNLQKLKSDGKYESIIKQYLYLRGPFPGSSPSHKTML